jgi:hypothetical protein
MAALKSRDMIKGMIVEFTNSIGKLQLGEQYEMVRAPYKDGSTALSIDLKKVGSDETVKPISVWWIYVNDIIKVISSPDIQRETFEAHELKAAHNEEFLFVSKTNEKLFYRTIKDNWYDNHGKKADDVIVGNLVFSKKSGQRKRLKNTQALYGFLHNHSGAANANNWSNIGYRYNEPISEKAHHMHAFLNNEYWFENNGDLKEEFKHLELRKYNRDTRKVLDVAVDFDAYGYVNKHFEQVNITYHYSEAVSNVIVQLLENQKWDNFSHIVLTKFNVVDYNTIYDDLPREKDVLFDVALKTMGIKKKDYANYNKNGFAAIAFATEEQANQFLSLYKDKEKIVKLISKDELEGNAEIHLDKISNFFNKTPQVKFKM